ncbi:MAG: septum formation initiator family protein [bacterium]|jgi:cell division protein FtsB|nr:septum formation initiator family protein [bacterium]
MKRLFSREFILILFLVLFAFAYSAYRMQKLSIDTLMKEEEAVIQDIAMKEEELSKLRKVRDELKSDQGLERLARERLKMVKPGEILVVPVEEEGANKK